MTFAHREHLLHYMLQGHVHLSKKDFGFYNNLQYIVKQNNRITTNQNKLFDKLTVKYQRQLKKLGHDIKVLQGLEWKIEVVTSAEEYLEAYAYLENDHIHIRSPFNTQFIQSLRNVVDNTFVWHKDKKLYISEFNTNALYIAVNLVKKHFEKYKFCDMISKTLEDISIYEGLDWNPTFKKVNGMYYISACNEHLHNALGDIVLSDDPKVLFILSQHGIFIDESVTNDDSLKVFSSAYHIDSDLDQLAELIEWLKLLEVDHVFTSREVIYNKTISNEIKTKLLEHGITCSPFGSTNHKSGVLFKSTSFLTGVNLNSKRIDKIIHLNNSRKVDVR